jgi:acyl-homoserine lactone acylase PvdQ
MQFYRALAAGKLSEMLGPEAIPIDKHMRTMGLLHRAKHHMSVID